ncbi:MAG: hypothetical protein QG671_3495 [Actinomycetota bacterium]|nr:hypothetical protein [Actinomycetota bacterium]
MKGKNAKKPSKTQVAAMPRSAPPQMPMGMPMAPPVGPPAKKASNVKGKGKC